ncbi:MAG: ATP-binding cassette domain-containing protein, partial [Cellulosilyticum sp.]|nr:ATP-binding cassette domain-containing protein [Cellulosilyticum sp.]
MSEEKILEVRELVKSYDGKQNVLDHISFSIKKGEVVVVIGPSGCGKSTFLRCLNKLESIQAGEILLDGINIRDNHTFMKNKLGFVSDENQFLRERTAMQNVELLSRFYEEWD